MLSLLPPKAMQIKSLRISLLLILWLGIPARSQDTPAQPPNPGVPSVTNSGTTTGNNLHPKQAPGPGAETGGEEGGINQRPFVFVLPRDHFLGDWWGLRTELENAGITPTLTYVSDIGANVTGGKNQGGSYDDNIGLNLLMDMDKIANIEGGTFLLSMSQRDGNSLSQRHVGNVFTIQQVYGGETFKIIDAAWQQKLLDDRVELRIGRIAAGDDFLVSKYDYWFMQNGFDGNPVGIFLNAPGMTAYPNSAWGALVKFIPTKRTYIMAGIYDGDTSIRSNEYHGLGLSMHGPIFAIGEMGYRCNGLPGDSDYLGDYKIGYWYDDSLYSEYGTEGYAYGAADRRGNFGIYGLFDQVVLPWGPQYSSRGLGVFGSVLVSPDQSVSQMPYFFTVGMTGRGFTDARPTDIAGFGVVYGQFSDELHAAEVREDALGQPITAQGHEAVLELTYRFNMDNRSLFFQPDLQYVIRPGGSSRVHDAFVIGCQIGVNF